MRKILYLLVISVLVLFLTSCMGTGEEGSAMSSCSSCTGCNACNENVTDQNTSEERIQVEVKDSFRETNPSYTETNET